MKRSKSFGLSSNDSSNKKSSFLDDFLEEAPSQKSSQKDQEQKRQLVSEKVTRQTFMIKESTLERLKDFVHTKRKYEDYNFSQKQALEEALKLLFQTAKIEERPR